MTSPSEGPGRGLVLHEGSADIARVRSPLAARVAQDLAARAHDLPLRATDDLAVREGPITVVWCEDQPLIADMFEAAWRWEGSVPGWRPHREDRLFFAPGGREALALADHHRATLFITDEMHLPGPRGRILLETMASEPHVALGYVTGCPLTPKHAAGLDLCMEKPVDLLAFLDALAPVVRALRRGAYTPPPDRIRLIHEGSAVP